MEPQVYVEVRRLDGRWRVCAFENDYEKKEREPYQGKKEEYERLPGLLARVEAGECDLEHIHKHPFKCKEKAFQMRDRVWWALKEGRTLNLAHWDSVALTPEDSEESSEEARKPAPAKPAKKRERKARPVVELTGYLGSDREVRSTKRWTKEVEGREVSNAFYEYTTEGYTIEGGGREYIVFSLAQHVRAPTGKVTKWHRCVVWNADRGPLHTARLCRKGDKVRIKGRPDEYTTPEGHIIRQIIVDEMAFEKKKAPEYG